jgi:hypothetical protein
VISVGVRPRRLWAAGIRALNDHRLVLPGARYTESLNVIRTWDRSAKWSQFRSTRRQRGWLLDRVRRDPRVRRRRSARCEKRGVKSDQGFGVAKLGTDGSARRSCLLSPAWWTGPPPIPRRGPLSTTNRLTRPPRRSLPQEAACGFWIRAWGQRGPALQGTGRSSDPARWLGLIEGGLDDPRHSRQSQLTSHRTPVPNVDLPRFSHLSVESRSLSFMR